MMKRFMDITVSLLLFLPALLICLVAALAIFIDIRANPIFTQRRVGRNRRPFTLLKMRTMPPDTPHLASHQVGAGAISRTGRLLRRLKIDELPQLWCVLRGEMSLVGPRPCLESQVELVEERDRLRVFCVRPGITGLAQIQGVDMSTPAKLAQIDAAYAANPSLREDFRILVRTAIGGGRGDAAA
jgi:lipopolysaccharide/colanic/teichoic acid biosynthesis glycosyltransferase